MITKLLVIDFDGTICDSPHPEKGKDMWKKYYNKEYPHIGWWSKPESLDLNVFDIKCFNSMVQFINKFGSDTYKMILTSRMSKLHDSVKAVLDHNNIYVDEINLKDGRGDKGVRLNNVLKRFPDLKEIYCFDDNIEDINAYMRLKNELNSQYVFHIYSLNRGNMIQLTESNLI